MNTKKLLALLLTVLLLVSSLAGCGATKDTALNYDSYDAMESPMQGAASAEGIFDSITLNKDSFAEDYESGAETDDYESSTNSAPADTDRKLIRKITMDTETEDMDTLLVVIDRKVSALGGYVESRKIYTGSRYSSYKSGRSADLTVRIPKENLDEFVAHVTNESNVTSSNETSDDVTLTYVAVQSRMTALQKEEARLLELIDVAANLTELLELEKRLTEVRTDLEYVTSQLLLYDNLVDYGTITISIDEVQKLTPVAEPGFWTRISSGFMESLRNLWHFLKELAIFLVVAFPYLLPFGIIALVIVLSIRRAIRKKRKARSKKEAPPTEPRE